MTLKPCPFCGYQPELNDVQVDDDGVWCVVCQSCDTEGPPGWVYGSISKSTQEDAIKRWNKREVKE